MHVSSNPYQEPTDRRAVCGKTACTVRREGRSNPIDRPYPYRTRTNCWLRTRNTSPVGSERGTSTATSPPRSVAQTEESRPRVRGCPTRHRVPKPCPEHAPVDVIEARGKDPFRRVGGGPRQAATTRISCRGLRPLIAPSGKPLTAVPGQLHRLVRQPRTSLGKSFSHFLAGNATFRLDTCA